MLLSECELASLSSRAPRLVAGWGALPLAVKASPSSRLACVDTAPTHVTRAKCSRYLRDVRDNMTREKYIRGENLGRHAF